MQTLRQFDDNYEVYPYIKEVNLTLEERAIDIIYLISILHNKTTFYKNMDLDKIKEANDYDVRFFSLKIPGYKRSRGVFDEPIYLSANAIYKVGMIFSRYDFSNADIDFKARAFQNAYKPTTRAGMGQYFTPIQVIKFIVMCISPLSSELIIDPFSGSAHFLTESLNYVVPNIKNNRECYFKTK